MVRLEALIQAHPARHDGAAALAAQVGAEVVWDPAPADPPSPWRTYRAALERHRHAGVTHRLILQDDAIPCARLLEAATAAVAARPDEPVAFYHGGQPREHLPRLAAAFRTGDPWMTFQRARFVPVVALCWPLPLIPEVLAWIDEQAYPAAFRADDEIVGRALGALGVPFHATVPSLVQHDDSRPSIMRARYPNPYPDRKPVDPGRTAAFWIGDGDPTLIRWA